MSETVTFDVLVSQCWADEVAAGHGKEGEEIQGFTGPFRVFSRLDKIDLAKLDHPVTVFVAPGTYCAKHWWEFWKR